MLKQRLPSASLLNESGDTLMVLPRTMDVLDTMTEFYFQYVFCNCLFCTDLLHSKVASSLKGITFSNSDYSNDSQILYTLIKLINKINSLWSYKKTLKHIIFIYTMTFIFHLIKELHFFRCGYGLCQLKVPRF